MPLGSYLNKKLFFIVIFIYILLRLFFFTLFPIYPDEIAVDWWITSDINKAPNIIIACNDLITRHSKFFNIFNNIEYIQNYVFEFLRTKTLFYYLIYLTTLLYFYIIKREKKYIALMLLSTIAPFAFTFILNRPEGFIFYFVFYFVLYKADSNNRTVLLFFSLYFFLLASISHPKTLYFSVIYLYEFRKNTLLVSGIILFNIFSYKYWTIRMGCSDTSILNFYSEFNINPLQVFINFKEYAKNLYNHNFCMGSNFDNCRWSRFFNNSYFSSSSDIGVYSPVAKNYLFQNLPKLLFVTTFIYCNFKLITWIFKYRKFHYLFFIFPVLFQLLHNRTQNFYDIAFWMLYIFSLTLYLLPIKFNSISKCFIVIILLFISILDYKYFYSDYLNGYQGPSLSTKFLRKEVKKLESEGISRANFSNYQTLILDDSTFRYFQNSNKILITYFSLRNSNLLDKIEALGSVAIVSRCVFFDEYNLRSLKPQVIQIVNTETVCIYTSK